MTGEIAIRRATRADAAEVAMLVNIATHGAIGFSWQGEVEEGTYNLLEVGRTKMLDDSEDMSWRNAHLAEVAGEVTGLVLGYPKDRELPPLPTGLPPFVVPIYELEWAAAGYWYLAMLATHASWRGRGIGAALLAHADTMARATSRSGVALAVEGANVGAQALYERNGFKVRDKRPMLAFPDGRRPGEHWLLMVKEF
jgi:ribosomal protein S18 acetylase RimI-like enzyme